MHERTERVEKLLVDFATWNVFTDPLHLSLVPDFIRSIRVEAIAPGDSAERHGRGTLEWQCDKIALLNPIHCMNASSWPAQLMILDGLASGWCSWSRPRMASRECFLDKSPSSGLLDARTRRESA